jgi:hypothetical protein
MKFKISLVLNIIFITIILFFVWTEINEGVGDFYLRQKYGIIASEAVIALDAGKTNLVHDTLSGIRGNPKDDALNEAYKKLHDEAGH